MKLSDATAQLEKGALVAAFLLAISLPLVDTVGRPLGGLHVPGGASYLEQLTLWLAFLGGLLAVREGKHLTLSTVELFPEGSRRRRVVRVFAYSVAAAVTAVLAYGSFKVVMADRQQGQLLPIGLPVWVSECVMPLAFALMSLRFALLASPRRRGRLLAVAAVLAVFAMGQAVRPSGIGVWLLVGMIVLAVLLGTPVFVAMAGGAMLLFFAGGTPVSAAPAEIYRLISSPTLPAIPLLTACGYVLAESRAAQRLVRFFRALSGWMTGGTALLVAGVCALFTSFTGGSGITIIALGGLVYPILREDGYPESFSLGLVTAAGSLGLLFPPSLPVILYSVVANVPADQLYLAALLPGLLLVVLVAGYGIFTGRRAKTATTAFSWREVGSATWEAKWELSIPVLVIGLFVSGAASLVEAAAAAAAYAIVVECFITRDIHVVRDLPRVLLNGGALMGGVLILLSSAMGLTSYLVDAQIPDQLLGIVKAHVHSQVVFLLVLNVLLLVLGSVLEIYSAIVVLAPLVVPLGLAFGVHPVHLGVIFLANLELGFLLPPIGLNLFLSASRFGVPMTRLYRYVVPFLIILGIGVLFITYGEWISLGVLRLFGR
ncbi:MAG TPA: TRAP transporter large permease subunit [Thermoanaerobaculaceae bacterium]|nr:TRAP transporter large permease subunit [Thermoanaerobaculaceae bacterium]